MSAAENPWSNTNKMIRQDILTWLKTTDADKLKELYQQAYALKREHVGTSVYFRGIIEFSNICQKNCLYCGIRNDNPHVKRYQMTDAEIIETAKLAHGMGYASIVLQSGERQDPAFIDHIETLLKRIQQACNGELGVTLSLGEQSYETYLRWFSAGAKRYLLRIETSNADLYGKLHPENHDYQYRLRCLTFLKKIGYQVGTGVMIRLPFQTYNDLCDDLLFFKKHDIDMIGMGPYIAHDDTPLGKNPSYAIEEDPLELSLKMIALTRILMNDINIASTTALQALSPNGRELGLLAGANIIMPNMTPVKYRKDYQLYENKPCLDENAEMCRSCLEQRIQSIGETIGYHQWGDSPHFQKRVLDKNKGSDNG